MFRWQFSATRFYFFVRCAHAKQITTWNMHQLKRSMPIYYLVVYYFGVTSFRYSIGIVKFADAEFFRQAIFCFTYIRHIESISNLACWIFDEQNYKSFPKLNWFSFCIYIIIDRNFVPSTLELQLGKYISIILYVEFPNENSFRLVLPVSFNISLY